MNLFDAFMSKEIYLDICNSEDRDVFKLSGIIEAEERHPVFEHRSLYEYYVYVKMEDWKLIALDELSFDAYRGETAKDYILDNKVYTAKQILAFCCKPFDESEIDKLLCGGIV